MTEPNSLADTLGELDCGQFPEKANISLKEVVMGVLATGKKGKLTLTFELSRIKETDGIEVAHDIKFEKPTRNGKAVENNKTTTLMYGDNLGNLSSLPFGQQDLFGRKAAPIKTIHHSGD